MIWARVGVKCVCVDDHIPTAPGWPPTNTDPVKGAIYTIRMVTHERGRVWLVLDELYQHDEFEALHFRPLVTRTQDEDVALFTHHLDKVGEPV